MSRDFQLRTKKGYDFFEITSAMQKCIRRGLEDKALYFTYELYQSGYEKYVWKRLLIISIEDIGMANPGVNITVKNLHDTFWLLIEKYKVGKDEALMCLTQAVMIMCRSTKSRLSDWTKNWCIWRHDTLNEEIPDFALDVHTRRGKSKGRGLKYFHDESSKVDPYDEQPKEAERKKWWYHFHVELDDMERRSLERHGSLPGMNTGNFKEPKTKKARNGTGQLFDEENPND